MFIRIKRIIDILEGPALNFQPIVYLGWSTKHEKIIQRSQPQWWKHSQPPTRGLFLSRDSNQQK